MKDFFISYTKADRAWAEWIAWQLEAAGHTVVIQAWDFRPGANFVLEMQRAAEARRTIAVLSPDYLASHFTQPEWAAAFAQDPTSELQLLLPVRVRECALAGLLPQIIYIDLVGLDEDAARDALLAGVDRARAKPKRTPAFPGARILSDRPRFPGALPPTWNVPYLRNPNFTGRAALLDDLRAALESGRAAALTQALHGLGGVGKTQLAVEYAYRCAADYAIVWWLRAEEPAALAADYAGLAEALDLPERSLAEQSRVVAAVRRWLEQNPGWLLIFDNANEPAELRDYLPRGAGGHILITSRNPSWGEVAERLLVQVLDLREAADLLLRRSGQRDRAAAERLAETLGRLPLALAQAGAYMEATGRAPAEYLALFASHQSQLLAEGQPAGYPATVATTWELSFQRVRKGSRAAAELLYLCAFLGPDAIPLDIVRAGAEYLPRALAAGLADSLRLDRALAALRRYSLAEVSGEALTLHRMVQAVVRERLDAPDRRRWTEAAVEVVNAAFPYESDDARTWSACARLLPHALLATEHAERFQVAPRAIISLLNKVGGYLRGWARFREAQLMLEQVLAISERVLGTEHPDTATILDNIAVLLDEQADYMGARPLYERALAIRERALGQEHPDTAQSVNNIATLLYAQGDYAGARSLCERALVIRERVLGTEHPDVAQSLSNLAKLLLVEGNIEGARPLCERALTIDVAIYGPKHPKVASDFDHLAALLQEQGDYVGAEPLYQKALAIRVEMVGLEHPDTANSLNNLAGLFYEQGDLANARPLFERALAIRERMLGPAHPTTAQSLNNLAGVIEGQGDYEIARQLYERALTIREQGLGIEHPDTAISLNNLAMLLKAHGDYASARSLYERALAIYEQALGAHHPKTATLLNNLAEVFRMQEQYAQARSLYDRALAIQEQTLGFMHPAIAQTLNNLAALLYAQADYTDARPLLERALAIDEHALGPDHPTTRIIRANLAALDAAQPGTGRLPTV